MIARLVNGCNAWIMVTFDPGELPLKVTLRTRRLVLRELELADWRPRHRMRTDPQVLQYLAETEPQEARTVRQLVRCLRWHACIRPRWVYDLSVVRQDSSEVIGDCVLSYYTPERDVVTLGFVLAREYWGQGYATELGQALVRFAFEELEVPALTAGCHPESRASARVLEKLGMRYQGPQSGYPGSPAGIDAPVFRLEREAWCAGTPHGSPLSGSSLT